MLGALGAGASALVLGATGASAQGTSSGAEAPPVRPPAPPVNGSGFYRFRVGQIECFSIGDGQARLPSYPLWGENASEEDVARVLAAGFVRPGPILAHFNVLMFRAQNAVWLVDSGNGPRPQDPGLLTTHMATLGVRPADVAGVIITHLHGDHFGGLFQPDATPTFPNARYFLQRTEAEFWGGASPDLSRTNLPQDWKTGVIAGAAEVLERLRKTGKLELVTGGAQIAAGVSVEPTGGHTPGHQIVQIESDGQQFVMLADQVHHFLMSFRRPEWHVRFDYDAKEGVRQRVAMLERMNDQKALVMCYHTPWPGVGYVGRRDGDFEWVPAVWEW